MPGDIILFGLGINYDLFVRAASGSNFQYFSPIKGQSGNASEHKTNVEDWPIFFM